MFVEYVVASNAEVDAVSVVHVFAIGQGEACHVDTVVKIIAQRGKVAVFVVPQFETESEQVARADSYGVKTRVISILRIAGHMVSLGNIGVRLVVSGREGKRQAARQGKLGRCPGGDGEDVVEF